MVSHQPREAQVDVDLEGEVGGGTGQIVFLHTHKQYVAAQPATVLGRSSASLVGDGHGVCLFRCPPTDRLHSPRIFGTLFCVMD